MEKKLLLPSGELSDVVAVNLVGTIADWTTDKLTDDEKQAIKELRAKDFAQYDKFMSDRIREGRLDLYVVEGSEGFPRRFKDTYPDSVLMVYSQCSEERFGLMADILNLSEYIDGFLGIEHSELFPKTESQSFRNLVLDLGQIGLKNPVYATHKEGEVMAAINVMPVVCVKQSQSNDGIEGVIYVATLNNVLI